MYGEKQYSTRTGCMPVHKLLHLTSDSTNSCHLPGMIPEHHHFVVSLIQYLVISNTSSDCYIKYKPSNSLYLTSSPWREARRMIARAWALVILRMLSLLMDTMQSPCCTRPSLLNAPKGVMVFTVQPLAPLSTASTVRPKAQVKPPYSIQMIQRIHNIHCQLFKVKICFGDYDFAIQ